MELRIASDIERTGDTPAPLGGQYLWQQTNQVCFPSPIIGYSGRADKKTVYIMRGGKCFRRNYVRSDVPSTERQLTQQERMRIVQKHYSTLSAPDRADWHAWALEHAFNDRSFKLAGNAGQNAYAHAQCNRLGWGAVTMSADPPTQVVPAAPLAIEQVAAPGPDVFAFRIRHNLATTSGCRVLFEMTPATETLRRTPEERKYAWAGERSMDSFLPLGPDGAVYVLDRVRHAIEPGRRYGVRVCILSPDGMASPKILGDFIRLQPNEPAAPEFVSSTAQPSSLLVPDPPGNAKLQLGASKRSLADNRPPSNQTPLHATGPPGFTPIQAPEYPK